MGMVFLFRRGATAPFPPLALDHRLAAVLFLLLLGVVAPAGAATPTPAGDEAPDVALPAPLAQALRTHKIAPQDVSFYVRDLAAATPVLAFNAEVPRNPASVIKLLTTTAGLGLLGPGYRWKTRAYVTGSLRQGRLEGDLILKGFGDPTLTVEGLWGLLWSLRERGVTTVAGDLIIDSEYFAPLAEARGDFDGAERSAYNALPYALSVHFQITDVHLLQEAGGDIRAFTHPPLANLEIQNELRLVQGPCQRQYHKPRIQLLEGSGHPVLRLTGTVADRCGESKYPNLLLDPGTHSAGVALALWQSMGGRVDGRVRVGIRPPAARLLHTLESEPLDHAIREINKNSHNLMSRTLFLTLGAERAGAPGTLEKSRRVLSDWLNERGLVFPELVVDNGAGLSRSARVSAASLGRLLADAYAAPTMPQFLSSLAIAGVDGTMRKRFRQGPVKGRAQVKTGTLRGATAMAGYVLDRAGRRWILVSLINHPKLAVWSGKALENTLIQWVYNQETAAP